VSSIVSDPNTDPHLYASNAADAAAVARASVVIENGAGYDDFLERLVGAVGGPGRTVITVQKVLGVRDPGANPHFWYDVPRVPSVAAAIQAALARVDPGGAAAYRANLAGFLASLRPIAEVLGQIRERHPGAPVAYTERLPEYLLAAAGLEVKTPAGFARAVEDGNDPSPGDTAAMDRLISARAVRVLVYNAQAVSSATENLRVLARQAKVPVVAVTETLPPSYRTYQQWQLAQAKAILQALGG
jgi:zinc/manganese transport system substrate-binding protein